MSSDWLAYYSSIGQAKSALEQRFVSLTVQQNVGAVAALALVGTIKEKLGSVELAGVVGVVATVAVTLLGYLAIKYFLQIREIGQTMARIEEHQLKLSPDYGVKLKLCKSKELSIFTIGRTPYWCFANTLLLAALLLFGSAALLLGWV